MHLYIMKEYTPSPDNDTMVLKSDMMKEKGTHLFIACETWESITVELHENLEEWYLHFLPGTCENIKVISHDSDISKYMKQLVELFPTKSGAIRRAVMQKQDLMAVLGDCVQCKV